MFTGLVEEVGAIAAVDKRAGGAVVAVACREVLRDASPGDSISVNGCCLTVARLRDDGFEADLMGETLRRTALGDAVVGAPVNLERAARADGRLGGHLVQGHVDAVAHVLDIVVHDAWTTMTFSLPDPLVRYVVEKGSIAVDGTSLTVAEVADGPSGARFSVGLIPHTLVATVLGARRVGDAVNLEVDIVAKYVERMLAAGVASPYARQEP